MADSGEGDPLEFPGLLRPGGEFSAQISASLTDTITLSVVFVAGGQWETQVLDEYPWLYSGSFPSVQMQGNGLWGSGTMFGQKSLEYARLRREDPRDWDY